MKILRHKNFLKTAIQGNSRQRAKILEKATIGELKALCEILLNIYNLNLPITTRQQTKLQKYKKAILKILSRKNSWDKKRQIFRQTGGFLPILAPTIISLLASLV